MADINMDNVNIEIQSSSEKASQGVEQLINTLNELNSTLGSVQDNVNNYTSSLEKISNFSNNFKMPNLSIKDKIPNISKELEFLNAKTPEIKTPKVDTGNIKKASKDIDEYKGKVEGLSSISDKISSRVGKMFDSMGKARLAGTGISKLKSAFSGLGSGIGNIGSSIASAGKKMLRLTTALFGIRSAFYAVRNVSNEFLSSQDATAKQLSANISYLKYAIGSTLAPVIEFITNLIYNLLKAIQSLVYFFFKINIFSRASAKNLASGAGSAKKTTKELQKQLQAFDELNNINLQNNAGSGGGSGGGISPNLDLSQLEDMPNKWVDMIKNGDWYQIGFEIGNKITEALENIPWGKIQEVAGKIGTNLALLLNGVIDGTNWETIGNTFAQGLNTVIEFGYNFITMFRWNKFGEAIGDTINGFIKNVKWDKLARTLSKSIKGIFDTIYNAFKTIEWGQIGIKLKEFLFNIDWSGIASSLASALGSGIGGISAAIASFISEAIIYPLANYLNDQIEEAGGNIIEGLLRGMINLRIAVPEWIYNNIIKPFFKSFFEALGVPELGEQFEKAGDKLMESFSNGLKGKIDRIIQIGKDTFWAFTSAFLNIGIWVNTNVVQPVINFFTNLWNGIVQIANNIYNGFTGAISTIANWINAIIVQPTIGFFTNLWNNVINIGRNIYNGFTGAIAGIANWVRNTVINPVVSAFNGLWNSITGIFNNIRNSITNALSNINIRIKLPHFTWSSQPASGWMANILSALGLPTSLPKLRIDWYAEGGFPTAGDLFVANEQGAEMVGSIGNKTAVANNDQITKAIAEATYQAVSQALGENNNNGQPIIVNVGNETLYKGMTKSRNEASNQYGITV